MGAKCWRWDDGDEGLMPLATYSQEQMQEEDNKQISSLTAQLTRQVT